MKWLAAIALSLVAVPLLAWQGEQKRLNIEPFATMAGSQKLREDLIAELRKAQSISVVSAESGADEILGGGGEVWVKAYRSLNPRSGHPISTFTWLMVPVHIADDAKRSAIAAFLKWMLKPGQAQAAALGYLEVPKDLLHREVAAIDRIQ